MKKVAFLILAAIPLLSRGQRTYKAHSVFASGNWYKIAVNAPGVYKLDIPFLGSLGINANGLASNSIRLFGNGGGMLPEPNNVPRADDLIENAILVNDGGDGVLNGGDFLLFFFKRAGSLASRFS